MQSFCCANTVVFGLAKEVLLENECALLRCTEEASIFQLVQCICEHLFHGLLMLKFVVDVLACPSSVLLVDSLEEVEHVDDVDITAEVLEYFEENRGVLLAGSHFCEAVVVFELRGSLVLPRDVGACWLLDGALTFGSFHAPYNFASIQDRLCHLAFEVSSQLGTTVIPVHEE